MHDYFTPVFAKQPVRIHKGDYYYNSDDDGDSFDETHASLWLSGVFEQRLNSPSQSNILDYFKADIVSFFAKNPAPFMEVACGPGMGLAPIIFEKYPDIPCLATDACSLLIESWRTFLSANASLFNISLAAFSVLDMPIKDNSLNMVTSNIGLSSTRSGEQGYVQAAGEVFRVLKSSGTLITLENEWLDYDAIKEVFRLWGKPMWFGLEKKYSWYEILEKCGFVNEAYDKKMEVPLRADDNKLGEQSHKFGIPIGLKYTLFAARKP